MFQKIINFFFNQLVNIVDFNNKKKIKKFFKKVFHNEIKVVDIGAHKGETINFFMNNFNINKIYSFEPNLKIFDYMKKKFNNSKIKIFNLGVGDIEEQRELNIYTDTFSSSYNDLDKTSSYFIRKKKISFSDYDSQKFKSKIITIDKFIQNEQLDKIDILKIDTEGYEFKILKGINEKNFKLIKFIYFEHHYNQMLIKNYTFSDISNLLRKNNFYLCLKLKMSFRKSFEYIYKNKFYEN
jgi:FkbM family methyltransferase